MQIIGLPSFKLWNKWQKENNSQFATPHALTSAFYSFCMIKKQTKS